MSMSLTRISKTSFSVKNWLLKIPVHAMNNRRVISQMIKRLMIELKLLKIQNNKHNKIKQTKITILIMNNKAVVRHRLVSRTLPY